MVMDVGQSLNPAIDIGQVEGGYVQGLGWVTIEELVWGDSEHPWVRPGTLQTRGPGRVMLDHHTLRNSRKCVTSWYPSQKCGMFDWGLTGALGSLAMPLGCVYALEEVGFSETSI